MTTSSTLSPTQLTDRLARPRSVVTAVAYALATPLPDGHLPLLLAG